MALSAASVNAATSGQDQVLQGIPAIAKAFAPVAGVKWEEFAQVLAGICAVESTCDPNYGHKTSSGGYSQYQGLFQMNMAEVAKAEGSLSQMLPQINSMAQSEQVPKDAYEFVQKAVQQAKSSSGDRRFLPAYGIILGAVKHIQINKQLADQYPGDPVRQAAGHMTAQFSGITEGKIRARQFNSLITGSVSQVNSEAWALGQNAVGGTTVAGAIEAAGARYQSKMKEMMNRMAQVTGNMTLIPKDVAPFNAPPFNPGLGGQLGVSYGGISILMEAGMITPILAPAQPAYSSTLPASVSNAAGPAQPGTNQNGSTTSTSDSSTSGLSAEAIIVQPTNAKVGESILVSWTSVNMRPSSCAVTRNDASFGSGAEGTKRDTYSSGTTYVVTCIAPTGERAQSTVQTQ